MFRRSNGVRARRHNSTTTSMTARNANYKYRRTMYNVVKILIGTYMIWGGTVLKWYGTDNAEVENHPSEAVSKDAIWQSSPEDVCEMEAGLIKDSVYSDWTFIDQTLKQNYTNVPVSGGIFLYPRQSNLLTALIQKLASLTPNKRALTICETGFGSGHSFSLFVNALLGKHPFVIVSFDKFNRPYQVPVRQHLNKTYYHQQSAILEYSAGDSCKTVPKYLMANSRGVIQQRHSPVNKDGHPTFQCDVLHGSSLCATDNIDLVKYSPCGVLLTTTAMGSLNENKVYFGPRAQWTDLRRRECITDIVCYQEEKLDVSRDFVFAKQGSTHQSVFCIAMTTGKCSAIDTGSPSSTTSEIMAMESCSTDIYPAVKQLEWDKFCPHYQIQPPPPAAAAAATSKVAKTKP